MVSNIDVDSRRRRLLTIDEVEQVQRQSIAGLIGHIFQLTYANMVDELIQEEKLNRCHGCAIQHPSQRQHSCLMMDKEDSWLYYREDVVEKIDLNASTMLKVCVRLLVSSLVSRGKCTSASYQRCLGPAYF